MFRKSKEIFTKYLKSNHVKIIPFFLTCFLFFTISCSGGYKQQPPIEKVEITTTKEHSPLYCGIAKIALTPYKNTYLAGYATMEQRMSEGTLYDKERQLSHDIYSKAVVFHNNTEILPGKTHLAYVSVDILIITDELLARVEKIVGDDTIVVLCATHPHSSIGGYWCCCLPAIAMGKYTEENLVYLSEKIAATVELARNNKQLAQIGFTTGSLDNITKNRRRDHDPVDTKVSLIHIEDLEKNALADMVWFAGHPTIIPKEVHQFSSDFPGAFSRILEKDTENYVSLFFQGGLGDVRTSPPITKEENQMPKLPRSLLRVEMMGQLIADKVKELRKDIQVGSDVNLKHSSPPFILGNVNVNAIPDFLIPLEIIGRIWVDWGYMPETSHLQITSIDNKIQSIAIANFPFEISSYLTIDLRKKIEQHYDLGIVTSLANSWYSYLMHAPSAMWPPSGPEYLESFFDPGYAESVMNYAYNVTLKMYRGKK